MRFGRYGCVGSAFAIKDGRPNKSNASYVRSFDCGRYAQRDAGKLLGDFETFGLLFESMCLRDLRVYADALEGAVYHYRDKTGLEADAVLVLNDGRWALVEVKLGSRQIDSAAANLKKLAAKIDADIEGEPSFLMVLTGTAAAYRREDGVVVAPLATLEP